MAHEMIVMVDQDANQILFSRLSAARRKQQSNLDDGDEELLEEEHEYRKEENLQEEVRDMFRELAVEHPIFLRWV